MEVNEKYPSWFVTVRRVSPLCTFLIAILAPGTTACEGSTTEPVSVANTDCAELVTESRSAKHNAAKTADRDLIWFITLKPLVLFDNIVLS